MYNSSCLSYSVAWLYKNIFDFGQTKCLKLKLIDAESLLLDPQNQSLCQIFRIIPFSLSLENNVQNCTKFHRSIWLLRTYENITYKYYNIYILHKIYIYMKYIACTKASYTQKYLFEILSNQTEIRLYLLFSNWFETKRASIWFQINRKMVNTIWFRLALIRFRKDFSVSANHVLLLLLLCLLKTRDTWTSRH